jgi:hypothetical protein
MDVLDTPNCPRCLGRCEPVGPTSPELVRWVQWYCPDCRLVVSLP